ncbi:MAG: hypothetical protein NVSMB25_13970 [Thermoleophilaceae bacterium]
MSPEGGALELRGVPRGLLDDPILLRARGAGEDAELRWRARYRDDDGRVWRASATRSEDLAVWEPNRPPARTVASLRSLRPVWIDVRVEAADGRTAARTLERRLCDDGVEIRRWRGQPAATLHLPERATPCATVLIDATAGVAQASVALIAAPLLASRGTLVLVVSERGAGAIAAARERLMSVPAATAEVRVLPAGDPFATERELEPTVTLPPGVGAVGGKPGAAEERAITWDRLLAELGARPRAGRDRN